MTMVYGQKHISMILIDSSETLYATFITRPIATCDKAGTYTKV